MGVNTKKEALIFEQGCGGSVAIGIATLNDVFRFAERDVLFVRE